MTEKEKPVAKPKRKMRPGGGKSKGNNFEGLIAKKLSAALPLNFIRSPGSGARVGGKNYEKIGMMFGEDALKLFVADVVPVNEKQEGLRFNYSIECKSYATQDNFTSLVSGNANIFKWFEESEVDAKKIGKAPMLIFKWNHTSIFVIVNGPVLSEVSPKITIQKDGKHLDVYEFEELIKHPDFWVHESH
jgi:hypothetical protein